MADDFKITVQKSMSLELTGRFNKDFANEFLRFLKTKHPHISRFYIDTHGLEHANPVELIIDEWSR